MDKIKLVRGDNRPFIKLNLKDADGNPINVQGATVRVYFRASGESTLLSTLLCTPVAGSTSAVEFNFPGTTLNVAPGSYEGEVEITFANGDKQTLYDRLKFVVREQFA